MDGLSRLVAHINGLDGTQAAFARVVGCSESHLSLILKGERGLSLGLAVRIERETGIPASSWVRQPEGARA